MQTTGSYRGRSINRPVSQRGVVTYSRGCGRREVVGGGGVGAGARCGTTGGTGTWPSGELQKWVRES